MYKHSLVHIDRDRAERGKESPKSNKYHEILLEVARGQFLVLRISSERAFILSSFYYFISA